MKRKLNAAVEDLRSQGINIIIGPTNNNEFNEIKKYNDMIFISPSNIAPEFTNNTISIGISLESQLSALTKFIKKQKKKKTVIMFPENEYTDLIKKKLKKLNLESLRTFIYSSNPQILT